MNVEDFVRRQTVSRFVKMGYSERDAKEVAERAVEGCSRNTSAGSVIENAIAEGKKLYRKRR